MPQQYKLIKEKISIFEDPCPPKSPYLTFR